MNSSFGTDEYIEKIVRTHSKRLLSASYAILKSVPSAEDAVQEVFIKLITKQPRFNDAEHEKAWLLRVTVNISLNMLKKAEKTDLLGESELIYIGSSDSLLLESVLALPVQYRTVIHLYYYEGYSIKEISSILRIPSATVGTRLARARKILKKELEEEGDLWL
ncbi:MAG: RNA polymerase sigma factor [Clostridia bacterium]|nr:RNA polymerase sigma factor [Clostridia bacterium]